MNTCLPFIINGYISDSAQNFRLCLNRNVDVTFSTEIEKAEICLPKCADGGERRTCDVVLLAEPRDRCESLISVI